MLFGTCKYVKKNSFPFPKFWGISFLFKKTLNVFLVSVYFILSFLCACSLSIFFGGGGGGMCVCVCVLPFHLQCFSGNFFQSKINTSLSVSVKRADLFVVKIIAKIKF